MKNYNYYLFLISLLLTSTIANAQTIKDPDEFLIPKGIDSLPKIFLLGTFHFEYPNLDANKVDKSKQIDILSEQKQKELQKLLDYVALFKPTKICIARFILLEICLLLLKKLAMERPRNIM